MSSKGTVRLSYNHVMLGLRGEHDRLQDGASYANHNPVEYLAAVVHGPDGPFCRYYPELARADIEALFRLRRKANRLERDKDKGKAFKPLSERDKPAPDPIPKVADPREGKEYRSRYGVAYKKRSATRDKTPDDWGNSSLSGRKQPGAAQPPASNRWKWASTERTITLKK